MKKVKKSLFAAIFSLAILFLSCTSHAATGPELNRDSQEALQKLYKTNPVALHLSHMAKGVLVFPNIVKAGLVFGGSYGEGVLMKDSKINSYYNTISASWGLQIGAQSYGYVLFLMSDKAINYLQETQGLEIGVGPTVVVIDGGAAKNLSTSTLKDDAYAFIFSQQGLMAGVSLEGSKITRVIR